MILRDKVIIIVIERGRDFFFRYQKLLNGRKNIRSH